MVSQDEIEKLINARVKIILRSAELLPLTQGMFHSFRKIVLDELGRTGLVKELVRVSCCQDRSGTGRNKSSKEGGAP